MSMTYLLQIFYECALFLWLCNLIKMCYTHGIILLTVLEERSDGDRRLSRVPMNQGHIMRKYLCKASL